MSVRLKTAILGTCIAVLAIAAPAHATFPGQNGKIAFENGNIYTVNPDGTGQTQVTADITPDERPAWSPDGVKLAFDNFVRQNCPGGDQEIFTVNADGTNRTRIDNNCAQDKFPAWSPGGTKIVFSRACGSGCPFETYTMNADGTNQARVTSTPTSDTEPTWSPDGTRIAFARTSCAPSCSNDIYVMNVDGTIQTNLTNNPASDLDPAWSPDGTKIAFTGFRDGDNEIYVMNADGTTPTNLTNNMASDLDPAWSPDGTKIAFTSNRDGNDEIYVMNADGTSPARLTNSPASDREPDWQPIPYTGYSRPRGATPLYASLVPAFRQCTTPNSTHGAPLAFGSCDPPGQASSYLTVGTTDANGQAANSVGKERLDTIVGDPSTPANEADVRFTISITDVRRQSDLSPYPGTLAAVNTLRITDHDPSDGVAATMQDIPFTVIVRCFLPPQTPPLPGSTCSVGTTANAVIPGAVQEGKRTIMGLDQVRLYDGGADNDASTSADNTLFAVQGVFVP